MKSAKCLSFLVFAFLLSMLDTGARACSVCMGAKSGPLADATNGAIFLLLGVLFVVLGLISFAGYAIVRRGQNYRP